MSESVAPLTDDERAALERIVSTRGEPLDMAGRLELAQAFRGRSRERGRLLDEFLVGRALRAEQAVGELRLQCERQHELLEEVLAPPWFPALFLDGVAGEAGPRARVLHHGTERIVALTPDIETGALLPGDEVFLGKELNAVVGLSPSGAPPVGETAPFERRTADGRLVLRCRDETVVVRVAGALHGVTLEPGDLVRWERAGWFAFEKLERAVGQELFVPAPAMTRASIGGQEANVERVLNAVTAMLVAPGLAARYGLDDRQPTILLHGPPGCGKTSIMRLVAAEVSRLTGGCCRIAVVKPGAWESPWVGETQRHIRECFEALRAAALDGPVVLGLDEIESIGRVRGGMVNHHADKFLAALLTEINGFADRGARVAILAATNRKDLVDPALLERLSEVEVAVERPDLRGARAIFDIHLPATVPFSPNGSAAPETRTAIIETAVTRFYAPNADNELCVLKFRDGKTRTVAARELASGRAFEQVCRAARHAALLRELRGGEPGVSVSDIESAIGEALTKLATTLSPRNAHAFLTDLPADADVLGVTPLRRRVANPRRYLNK